MPPRAKDDVAFPLPAAWRALSRPRRILLELSTGLIVLALVGLGASLQMPLWLRLTGWASFALNLLVQSILVVQWQRRRRRERELRTALEPQPVAAARRADARQ